MNRGKATISELRSDHSLLGARVALREALCACALQIIIILFELRVFLPVKIKN
jgi:hypothetical protein